MVLTGPLIGLQSGKGEPAEPGLPVEDLSPEARKRQALHAFQQHGQRERAARMALLARIWLIIKRVVFGCFNDGLIHAGNLAYMSLLAIFPFFLTGAAAFTLIGEADEQAAAVGAVLAALPPVVSEVLRPVALSVIDARSGWFLWVGGLVGLWTVGSLIETIRDILRRAYGTTPTQAFWRYRLFSTAIIIAAVLLLMLSLIAQVAIGTAEQVISVWMPELNDALGRLAWSRIIPALGLFGSIYLLFYTLTPAQYRQGSDSFLVNEGFTEAEITHRVEAVDFAEQKRASMRVHASQMAPDHFLLAMPDPMFAMGMGVEFYIVESAPTGAAAPELFEQLVTPMH